VHGYCLRLFSSEFKTASLATLKALRASYLQVLGAVSHKKMVEFTLSAFALLMSLVQIKHVLQYTLMLLLRVTVVE